MLPRIFYVTFDIPYTVVYLTDSTNPIRIFVLLGNNEEIVNAYVADDNLGVYPLNASYY